LDRPQEKEPIMLRSVAVLLALLILPSLVSAQELNTPQEGTHEVVKGETLWALAERYLGDPFRWPLIYEANRDRVEDPHWIYPHQLLVIPGLEAEPAQVQDVAVVTPVEGVEPVAQAAPADLPACPTTQGRTVFYAGGRDPDCTMEIPALEDRTAFYTDPSEVAASITGSEEFDTYAVPRGLVYSTPWLTEWRDEVPSLGHVAAFAGVDAEASKRDVASSFERLQLHLNEGVTLRVGDLLQTFVVGRSEEGFGQVVEPTGILAVTSVEEAGSVAMVSAEFARVGLGQKIRMAPEYSVQPNKEAVAVESNLTATIVGFDVDRVLQGMNAVAFFDVGEEEGITLGDEFLAYVNRGDGWEGEEAARFQVVLVNGGMVSARILSITEPVLRRGMKVYLVGKMN
jgi:hypothetical protein